jgi:hypothetical protein
MSCVVFQIPPKVSGKCIEIVQGTDIPEYSVTVDALLGIDFTDVDTTVELKLKYLNKVVLSLSKGNGITVNSALKITFDRILGGDNNLPVGTSCGRIVITKPDGSVSKDVEVQITITKAC